MDNERILNERISALEAALEEVLRIANTVISTSTMPEPAWMEKVKAALALAKGEN